MPHLPNFRHSGTTKPHDGGPDKRSHEFDDLAESGKQPTDPDAGDIQVARWRALFFFTTRPHTTCLTVGIATAVLSGLASPASALLTGKAFQAFAGATDGKELVKKESTYALYLMGVAFASWVLHFVFFAAWVVFGELQAKSARDRLFQGMLVKEVAWYDLRRNGVGALIPRLQAQIRELQLATAQPFGSLITTISTAVFNIGLALWYSWKITLVIIASLPVTTMVLGYLGATMQPHVKQQQEKLTEALKHVSGALASIETVKCFNGQEIEATKYATAISASSVWYMRVVRSNALQFAFTSFMASAMFVQGFYYGGVLVRKGEKTTGDVVTCFVAALGAFQAIASILPQMIVLEKGRTAGATLRAVMTQIEGGLLPSQAGSTSKPGSCQGDINLKNLSFAYPSRPDQMVLRNVNLFIQGGCTTFIIGKSGSGKSTLGQLLMRFYTPVAGEILFDGVSISKLDTAWLRSCITLVEQNSTLFEDTVQNNIALGRTAHPRVTRVDVMQAVEFALLQLTINDLPQGVDTLVGTKGSTMSGGQRQRMALARAYLRDTPVLVLDESTSALDQISRSLMMDAIRTWRQDKTTIVITHDIAQVLPNDYAIILEQGCLVQEGYRRHMERIEGSPFQSFLTENTPTEALQTPYNTNQAGSTNVSVEEFSSFHPRSAYIDDPLDAHLTAGERLTMSLIPTAFANKHTSAVLQGAGRFARPASTYRPAFSPMPSYSPFLTRHNDNTGSVVDAAARSHFTTQTHPPSLDLEDFIDNTGRHAARTRLRGRRQLQRLYSSPTQSQFPVKRSEGAFTKRLRRIRSHHNSAGETHVQSILDILKTIWPNLTWSVRVILLSGLVCTAIGAAAIPVFSFVLSRLIQTYSQGKKGEHVALVYSLSIIGIACVTAFCAYMQHYLLEFAGQQWANRVREIAFERILNQPRDFLTHEENSASRITEGLDRHAEEMRNLLGRFAATVLTAFIMVTVSLIWAMITQWKITLIALSVAPYVFVVTRAFGTVSARWEARSTDAAEKGSAIFFETFTAIKTVRALTLEKHFSDKYSKATRVTLLTGIKRALWSGFFYGLSDSSGEFVMALIFYAGAVIVKDGAPAAKVIEVFIQLIITINNISILLSFIPQMSTSKDMASRLLRRSELPKTSHEHTGQIRVTSIGDIVFTDLSFSYPSRPEQTVLKHISFVIPHGKCTAIVGSSGSGKSTVAALLMGLYTTTPPHHILQHTPDLQISGRDIKMIHTPTLRTLVTVVAQSPTLFSTTVADNIVYGLPLGSPCNDPSCIRQAAAAAGIDEFIMTLPEGYDTMVGDGGIGLSGGQAQRMAIARALVRKPAVLILDEATSALDVESAELIKDTIHRLVERERERMTVVIITHSLDMMAVADNVVVLDRGEVVEQGAYDELLARTGAFRNLVSGGEWEVDTGTRRTSSVAVEGMTGAVDWGGKA